MPYQQPMIKGTEAIVANLGVARDSGATQIELKVAEGESQGNVAWGSGTYKLKAADGSTFQSGKWLNVSAKIGGEWKIIRDIWNTDAPE